MAFKDKAMGRTYLSWRDMMRRCNDPNHSYYGWYGGRGISVHGRWIDFHSFVDDMGAKPDGLTLDRINNGGNYEPGNCRWASHAEQHRNTTKNRFITHDGLTLCLRDWERHLRMGYGTLWRRLARGLSVADALNWKPK